MLVNPIQIPWANQCFSPSQAEREHASEVMDAVEAMYRAGESVAMLNGQMIGPPMIKRACKVLELDRMIREKEERSHERR